MLIVNKENVCGETYLYGKFFQQICYSIYILFNKRTRKKRNIYDPQLTGNYHILVLECITSNYFMDMWKWKAIPGSKREDHKKWNTLLRRAPLNWSYGWSRSNSDILFKSSDRWWPKIIIIVPDVFIIINLDNILLIRYIWIFDMIKVFTF